VVGMSPTEVRGHRVHRVSKEIHAAFYDARHRVRWWPSHPAKSTALSSVETTAPADPGTYIYRIILLKLNTVQRGRTAHRWQCRRPSASVRRFVVSPCRFRYVIRKLLPTPPTLQTCTSVTLSPRHSRRRPTCL
jgi:hypothetical protein